MDQPDHGLAKKRAHTKARVSSGAFVFDPTTIREARRRVIAFMKATEDHDSITQEDAECIIAMGKLAPTVVGNAVPGKLRLEAVKVIRSALQMFSMTEKEEPEIPRYEHLLDEEKRRADLVLSQRRRNQDEEEDDEQAHRPVDHDMRREAMEEYLNGRDREPYRRWSDNQAAAVRYAHLELGRIDSSFAGLDPQFIHKRLSNSMRRTAKTGAGNFGAAHIVATLSLRVEALGACLVDSDKVDVERHAVCANDVAVKRITNTIQQAIKRADERENKRKPNRGSAEDSASDWINDPVRFPGK